MKYSSPLNGDQSGPGDQTNKWSSKGLEPIQKADTNRLSSATSTFTDTIRGSVDSSESGSYAMSIEENKDTREQRFTLYERPITSAGAGWSPLSAPQAGAALAGLGYQVPSSLDPTRLALDQIQQHQALMRQLEKQSFTRGILRQLAEIQKYEERVREMEIVRQTTLQIQRIQSEIQKHDERVRAMETARQLNQQLGGVDFSSIQLEYVSLQDAPSGEKDFSFALKAQKAEGGKIVDLKEASALSAKAFIAGLTIPNHKFWVNLNPWEPERIIEKDVSPTDVGRIMLEADLQMKKDFNKYEDPCHSQVGVKYWKLLDEEREKLIGACMKKHPGEIKESRNILFSATTRHWIVPDGIKVYGNDEEAYVANATLKIYSEPVAKHSTFDIANQDRRSISKGCLDEINRSAKIYGEYVKELEDRMILPLVVQDINRAERYSELRQVYISLALAQWCKERRGAPRGIFSKLINSASLKGIEAQTAWNPKEVWNRYVKSFKEGEYNCCLENTTTRSYEKEGGTVTETLTETKCYKAGGVDFTNLMKNITLMGDLTPKMRAVTSDAVYRLVGMDGDNYHFGDCIYIPS
jgi:hypothetical protein